MRVEPRRFMGRSPLRFLEEYASIERASGYSLARSELDALIDFARNNFAEFIIDTIDDYLDREIAKVFRTGFGRIRFDIEVYPRDVELIDYSYRMAVSPSPQGEPSFIRTMNLRVSSNRFGPIAVEFPLPYADIFYYIPSRILDLIYHIGESILSHIDGQRQNLRQNVHGQRLVYEHMYGTFRESTNPVALELLMSHCTKEQERDYRKHNWFVVVGGTTGNKYRIRKARQINIDLLDGAIVMSRYCTVADPKTNYGLPIEDQLLAQKTLIELKEELFLETAIKHPPPFQRGYYG